MKKLSKEQKAEKWLKELADKGNQRASLLLSILENATPQVKNYHLKIILPMLEGAKKIAEVYEEPAFKREIMRKKDSSTDV